ncbi:hypothetical protein [Leptospira bandrabouensis]|uniref:Uncharacterized protein n=1 Tax=Leptospira bandrabouensis TaxID=2484903 RepID=A0A6H3NTG4_9LEPT|nr:hypothetical protein [Leptospira bandrabouensis]MCG6145202.1 hypothetical protein [Leptospira bandrabouensis]MCG6152238.1 hypothetical protein [Leptospira bandrabouensis]MCG6161473.1 hypothetical protein [Leptospira bandrabouensis]MCG6165050.1 hypothetical protein [Leptospira bandrabouensis]MCW7457774.1 hypothetical protein [Leptospira bandrabouensis]
MAEPAYLLNDLSPSVPSDVYESIRNRALGLSSYDFQPYSCFIEYKSKDENTGIEYRDCIVDYTRCSNSRCIKKLV